MSHSRDTSGCIVFAIILLAGVLIGFFVGVISASHDLRCQAVDHGAAEWRAEEGGDGFVWKSQSYPK